MTNQDKWLLGLRIVALICVLALVALAVNLIESPGVRAPLLTMMGGVTIVKTLYPPRVIAMPDVVQDVISLTGTGIAITGAFYWLSDAAQKGTVDDLLRSFYLAIFLILQLCVYVFLIMLIFADWSSVKQATETAIRKITRR